MRIFVDTSVLFALMDRGASRHGEVVSAIEGAPEATLVTHAYVVVETVALVRARLGAAAAGDLLDAVLPGLAVEPVDRELHDEAIAAFRVAPGRVSLVDRTSFAFMRRERIDTALALDADFRIAGFQTRP